MTSPTPGIEPGGEPSREPTGPDPRLLVGPIIAAIALFLPFRAAPGESPWPAALAFAAFGTLVALGGWWFLRRTPPME